MQDDCCTLDHRALSGVSSMRHFWACQAECCCWRGQRHAWGHLGKTRPIKAACEVIILCQALQEAMQAGHLAASKHGLSANLPAHTAIVAVASPVGGHHAAAKTLQENVKLPPTLLASFDLIYELNDQQSMQTVKGGDAQGIPSECRSISSAFCSCTR